MNKKTNLSLIERHKNKTIMKYKYKYVEIVSLYIPKVNIYQTFENLISF